MNPIARHYTKSHRKAAERYERHPWLAYIVVVASLLRIHSALMRGQAYGKWVREHSPALAKLGGDT